MFSTLKRFSLNSAVFFCSILLALCLAEIIVRMFVSFPEKELDQPLRNTIFETHDNLKIRYRLTPGKKGSWHQVSSNINSYGLRDREYSINKPEGTKRIIFLGDSVTYGDGLEENETVPSQLEQIYASNSQSVEVLNFGVPGYETEQEIELFKEIGLQFKPDLVVVGYCLNDSNLGSGEILWFHSEMKRRIKTDQQLPLYKRYVPFLHNHSMFFRYVDRKFRLQERYRFFRPYYDRSLYGYIKDLNSERKDAPNSPYRQLEKTILDDAKRLGTSAKSVDHILSNIGLQTSDINSAHWNVSKKSLAELKQLSNKHVFEVVVVVFPIVQEMDKYCLDSLHAFLKTEIQGLGISVIDLSGWGKDVTFQYGRRKISLDSIHLTPLGAKFAGRYIYTQIHTRQLLNKIEKK